MTGGEDRDTDRVRSSTLPTLIPGQDEEVTMVSGPEATIPPSPRVPVWLVDEAGRGWLADGEIVGEERG